jgi:hypothetical protein
MEIGAHKLYAGRVRLDWYSAGPEKCLDERWHSLNRVLSELERPK